MTKCLQKSTKNGYFWAKIDEKGRFLHVFRGYFAYMGTNGGFLVNFGTKFTNMGQMWAKWTENDGFCAIFDPQSANIAYGGQIGRKFVQFCNKCGILP